MASVNTILLIGRIGKDPETHTFDDGGKQVKFSLATTDKWTSKTGEKKEDTQWHNIVANDKLADICEQYLKKGMQVFIEGSIRYREYEKDGTKRYITEIRADKMQMLGGKDKDGVQQSAPSTPREQPAKANAAPATGGGFDDFDDGIPF